MEDPLISQDEATEWYENDHPIQEYLNRSKKPSNTTDNFHTETPSRLKMMKKSIWQPHRPH